MSERLNIITDEPSPIKSIKNTESPTSWFSSGLRFKCTGCGQCCTGAPGYVWVTIPEIKQIADHLQLSVEDFQQKYVRQIGERYSLIEHSKTYDCVFLKDKKCQIYSVRPKQCRTFPWWQHNLHSEAEWNEASKYCEGINHPEAPLISAETISQQLSEQNGAHHSE